MSNGYTIIEKEAPPPIFDLTVVTVCRNVLPSLIRTVDSVLAKKATSPKLRIEHVVVDGASEDGTSDWLQKMKEAGKIEIAISEPDMGIYDAMNKGINLARGAAVLFLNADDTFTNEDITPCVMPIVRGKTVATAAATRYYSDTFSWLFSPDTDALYLRCPFCHQAYFAAARVLREIGGFDCKRLRCACDADMMYKIMDTYGLPKLIESIVSEMPAGGFSDDCGNRFRDEYIEMLYRNRVNLFERCIHDSAYRQLILSTLLYHALALRDWQQTYGRKIPAQLDELQQLCEQLADIVENKSTKKALLYTSRAYLQLLRQEKQPSLIQAVRLLLFYRRNAIPAGSPYRSYMVSARRILSKLLHS